MPTATQEKRQTDAGRSILLSDNTRVMAGTPEWDSLQRLSDRNIIDVWGDTSHVRRLFSLKCYLFSDLQKLSMKQLESLPSPLLRRIECRRSSRILCDCGKPFMLHRAHVTCERPGCVAFRYCPDAMKLRAAFPDQISHTRGE